MWKELFSYIKKNSKWILIPPVIVFFVFAVLLVFAETSPISPFIYMLF